MKVNKDIELELRAEIAITDLDSLISNVEKRWKLVSHSRRLSIMFLGKTADASIDIRVRVDDTGKAELVIKKGDFHTHNRVETSEPLAKEQVLGMVKILSLLDFSSKVTERENFVYSMDDDISFSIIKAGTIAYVEIEKMSFEEEVEENKNKLLSILHCMGLTIITTKEQFDDLCSRLSDLSDWKFNSTKEDFQKLEIQLKSYC